MADLRVESLMGDIVNFEGGGGVMWLDPLVVQVGVGGKD